MGAVAAGARVATGTLYRHFRSKTELCTELFRDASQREVNRVKQATQGPGSAAEKLARTTRLFASRAIRGRHLSYALIAEPLDPALEQERLDFRHAYAEVFCTLLEEGVASGEFAPLDPHIGATALVGLLAETLVGPVAPSSHTLNEQQQEQLINEISRFSLRAVGCKRIPE